MAKTVADLYREILGREPDPSGLAHWSSRFGDDVNATERQLFLEAARSAPGEKSFLDEGKTVDFSKFGASAYTAPEGDWVSPSGRVRSSGGMLQNTLDGGLTWVNMAQPGGFDRDQTEIAGALDPRLVKIMTNEPGWNDPLSNWIQEQGWGRATTLLGNLDYRTITEKQPEAFSPETYWTSAIGNNATSILGKSPEEVASRINTWNTTTTPTAEDDGDGGGLFGLGDLGTILLLAGGAALLGPAGAGLWGAEAAGAGALGAEAAGTALGSGITAGGGLGLTAGGGLGLTGTATGLGTVGAGGALTSAGLAGTGLGAGWAGLDAALGAAGATEALGSGISATGGNTGLTGTITGDLAGNLGALGSTTGAAGLTGTIEGLGTLTAEGMLIPAAGGAAVPLSSVNPSLLDTITNLFKTNPTQIKSVLSKALGGETAAAKTGTSKAAGAAGGAGGINIFNTGGDDSGLADAMKIFSGGRSGMDSVVQAMSQSGKGN